MERRVAIVSLDERFIDNVSATLANMSIQLDKFQDNESVEELFSRQGYTSIIFDESFDLDNQRGLLAKAAALPTSIICTDGDEIATINLLERYSSVMHVFGKNKPYYDVELATALQKIIHGKPGGIEDYLSKDTTIRRLHIVDYDRKNEYLNEVYEFADSLQCFPDFASMVATVTWELLMNAMFDAPVDRATGKKKYAHLPRTQSLQMTDDEAVSLMFGSDEHSFVVSVRDNFGALTRQTVIDSLVRCSKAGEDQIRSGNAGAGVGLYMLFNSISQINFDIRPGEATEVIFVVFLSKRRKDFVLRARSVNFFVGG